MNKKIGTWRYMEIVSHARFLLIDAEYFSHGGQVVSLWEEWQRRIFPLVKGEN